MQPARSKAISARQASRLNKLMLSPELCSHCEV
jgi:hypothetical protein